MSDESTARDESTLFLQNLIDRVRRADPDARNELISLAYDRLRVMARKTLGIEFPPWPDACDPASAAHDCVARLLTALDAVDPESVADFLGFAAAQIRRELQKPVRKPGHPSVAAGAAPRPTDDTAILSRLALSTEFHEAVNQLPQEERQVIDLCWYMGWTHSEAATVLEIHPKEVSRRWIRAIRKLPSLVPEGPPS